jgi:hypothetical protein
MNKIKLFLAKRLFPEIVSITGDASGSSGGASGRELSSEFVKRVNFKSVKGTDFEKPEFDMEDIRNGYDTDSYIRQGVDKYVDQIFKEGYTISGTDPNVTEYINLRLAYIAEATQTPTEQFLIDIAEDIVKYGNCMIVKSRTNDPNAFPQGQALTGLYGKDAVGGYFCADPISMTCKRDDHGLVTEWQQETDAGKQTFGTEDVIHIYYKREKGAAYGKSFLIPVLDDVRALRQAEENVLKMMYRFIYPFYHVQVGTEDDPGKSNEVSQMQEEIEGMDVEGGLVTTERVNIKPIASDKVINADPYLKYMESRVFTGFGIPEIMWGRGNTANRSTGDNMTSEMADRIRAIHKIIEMFFNAFIIKELLMEGGYDPVLNPDQGVELKFNDNDVDVEIKKQVHAIYKYEHNAITEDEMRSELGMDPIEDSVREHMFIELITRETMRQQAQLDQQVAAAGASASGNSSSGSNSGSTKKTSTGTKETNNKSKNGGGRPKTNAAIESNIGITKDMLDNLTDSLDNYVRDCYLYKYQIERHKITDCIVKNVSSIILLYNDEKIKDYTSKLALKLDESIHDDILGTNTYVTSQSDIQDMINIRVDIFKNSLIRYIREGPGGS